VVSDPINPGQLTKLPFGSRSFWLQPWRSSMTTRSAASLQDAIGINVDNQVTPQEAPATLRLLHDSGFHRARLEIGWDQMSYSNPSQIADPGRWTPYLAAMRTDNVRPLILLNANQGGPTPMKSLSLTLTTPAAQGATTMSLDAASAARVQPGLTGLNADGLAAGVLITSVDPAGNAILSRPLPMNLGVGPVAASTLRYAPFAAPYLADGAPNPRFQQTLSGWLTYVKGVTQFVRNIYGSDNFDVEVWNELSNNSSFLDERNYFSPLPDPGGTGTVTEALLKATVQTLHDPANGLSNVQIGDGFSNEVPWTSGATVPAGVNAIDKHPYHGAVSYPAAPTVPGIQPLDALGRPSYRSTGSSLQDVFTPQYRVFMPEYYLTGLQTETLTRDLSPITTTVYGTSHGAQTHPAGTSPPSMWITEDNLDAGQAQSLGLPAANVPEFQAKAALRFFTSYASQGAKAIDLFAAKGGPSYQLIGQSFFAAVDANPASYPASLGGRTMQAVARLNAALSGAQPIADPRQLTLSAIAQDGNDAQFSGDGTAAHPSLYNRNVLAFFPFQVSQHRFVSAVYVTTSDLTHYYTSHPSPGQTPYDLPAERFRLTIGGVNAADATVSLQDPLSGTQQPATILARHGSQIVVQLQATDSPRMLTINDGPATASGARLTLNAPARVRATTVRRHGIKLRIQCRQSCRSLRLVAESASAGERSAGILGRASLHPRPGATVKVTLKLTRRGREWLAVHAPARLRVTTVGKTGSTVSKVIYLTGSAISR
jgi:hypothetical protein